MNLNYSIKSKINIKPSKKSYLFNILLNIFMIFIMIACIIKILFDGVDLNTIGLMILTYVVVSLYKVRLSNKDHYESVDTDIIINNKELKIIYQHIKSYKNKDYIIEIPLSTISVLKFSDQLCCLHICGNINTKITETDKTNKFNEHYLYLEKDMAEDMFLNVQKLTGISIKYMDRK